MRNFLRVSAIAILLSGCSFTSIINPQKDMHNFYLQVKAASVEQKKALFDAEAKDIEKALIATDKAAIISRLYYPPESELIAEEREAAFETRLKFISDNKIELSQRRSPKLAITSDENFGYSYFYNANGPTCESEMELGLVLSDDEDIKIFTILFEDISEGCVY